MKSLAFKIALGCLFVFILASCQNLEERNSQTIDNMPYQVRRYVREFIEEGAKRGHKVKLNKLRIQLVTYKLYVGGEEAAAAYNKYDHQITINSKSYKWNYDPRPLIFHELGHAILKLGHHSEKGHIMSDSGVTQNQMSDELIDELFSAGKNGSN